MTDSYTAKDLADKINYRGQEQAARILLIKMNTVPVEKIAIMSDYDVYEALLERLNYVK